MRVKHDDIRVEFKYRGTPNWQLPVAVRPRAAVRGVGIIGAAVFLWGAMLSGPLQWVQPGPGGVVVTAVFALVAGGVTGVWLTQALSRWDSVERPLRHTARSFRSEVLGERPAPPVVEVAGSAGVFPRVSSELTVSRSDLVGVDCVRKNCWCSG